MICKKPPIKIYEILVRKAHGLTEEDVLKIAREGRKAHKTGKAKEISSLADLCMTLVFMIFTVKILY